MPSNRGLFDRLRRPEGSGARSVHQSTEDIADSVLGHLQRMMNARHGEAPAALEYGIPALEAESMTSSEEMRRAIEKSIRTYEPRLQGVRVRAVPKDPEDPLKVRFEIHARLVTSAENVRVRFSSELDSAGAWKVRG